jgi:2-polyprenyl-6-methoxyphenol hydroxylase-like FAD-dependent oxidoreductase
MNLGDRRTWDKVDVMVVGGGPVGAAAALFLARRGVTTLVAERRTSVSPLPRAFRLHSRTVELFREADLEMPLRDAVRTAGLEQARGVLSVGRLRDQGTWLVPPELPLFEPNPLTPTGGAYCPQHLYQALLLNAARNAGANVQFGYELVSLRQDGEGVTAHVQADHEPLRQIAARYLIAADGTGSTVRRLAGIGARIEGVEEDEVFPLTSLLRVNLLFRADLAPVLAGRSFFMCMVDNAEVKAALAPHEGGTWALLGAGFDPAGRPLTEYPEEACLSLVRAAVGVADLDVEPLHIARWRAEMHTASAFRRGAVFLAGDAAHSWPPVGGHGVNTGIADAHNLAWKLAAVLDGWAGEALLDTYEQERRPIAVETARQAVLRGRTGRIAPPPGDQKLVDDTTLILGYRYSSAAVAGARYDHPLPDHLELTGQPGTRAPHVAGEGGGAGSPLDLFGRGFVLITSSEDSLWSAAAARAAESGIPVRTVRVGPGGDLLDDDGRVSAAYRLRASAAVLVRPDGFVGWRADRPEAADELAAVLDRLVSRPEPPLVPFRGASVRGAPSR